ncbi:hypothetical protein A2635_01880 [Candidatus Peribacteria bacterium RIFCSPHIGHO2_01_FULL_51_9]|nr:MAG: hypothetical protein A2635_01880 [Candidatus Peribacteria bacterium RIFCSPHIGHO2_01_FULL_51_9]
MTEKCAEWPSDEEMDFVNAGGDILDISNPPPEVIQRVTKILREEWGIDKKLVEELVQAVSEE